MAGRDAIGDRGVLSLRDSVDLRPLNAALLPGAAFVMLATMRHVIALASVGARWRAAHLEVTNGTQ